MAPDVVRTSLIGTPPSADGFASVVGFAQLRLLNPMMGEQGFVVVFAYRVVKLLIVVVFLLIEPEI
jgi:hypothetical protein